MSNLSAPRSHPYRESSAQAPVTKARYGNLGSSLGLQIFLHVLVLLTYGLMSGVFGLRMLDKQDIVLALPTFAGLASAVNVLQISLARSYSLRSGALKHRTLGYESAHYALGLVLCVGLSIYYSPWCLPALAFCIYSLILMHRLSDLQRAENVAST
jgi:hypothetical protein